VNRVLNHKPAGFVGYRMIQATSSSGWGEAYGFDAFGNLTTKTGSGGAPQLSVLAKPVNNQIQQVSGLTYDANGNEYYGGLTYDAENRVATVPGLQYAYDAQNKRIWHWTGSLDSSGWGNASGYNIFLYALPPTRGTQLQALQTRTSTSRKCRQMTRRLLKHD
jgi:hypothetical protein